MWWAAYLFQSFFVKVPNANIIKVFICQRGTVFPKGIHLSLLKMSKKAWKCFYKQKGQNIFVCVCVCQFFKETF